MPTLKTQFFLKSILWISKNREEVEEEVDDVQVEVEGREDVLLRTEGVLVFAAQHDLGVVDQVEGEDEAANSGVTNVGSTAAVQEIYWYSRLHKIFWEK